MTLKQAAQAALDVQDAVNLSGVVRSYRDALLAVWDEAHRMNQGTAWVNRHPVALLFASKVGDMTGLGGGPVATFSQAWTECTQLASKEE